MAEEGQNNNLCQEEPGFPKLLCTCLEYLGIERPEYSYREYEARGTHRCEVIIYVGRSTRYTDIEPWQVTATGFRLQDTYLVAARKALRYMCSIYERHLEHTSMKFFPPIRRNSPIWLARMETLESGEQHESEAMVLHMCKYLTYLDKLYDQQATKLRKQIRRTENAEASVRRLQVYLAEALAKVATAQSKEAAAMEALRQAQDRHAQELREAHLVGRARRRMLALVDGDTPILEGIPIDRWVSMRQNPDAPPAPPPSEASKRDSEATEEEAAEPSSLEEDVAALLAPLENHTIEDEDSLSE